MFTFMFMFMSFVLLLVVNPTLLVFGISFMPLWVWQFVVTLYLVASIPD